MTRTSPGTSQGWSVTTRNCTGWALLSWVATRARAMRPGPSPQCSGRCGRNAGASARLAARSGPQVARRAGRRRWAGCGLARCRGPGQVIDRRLELRLRLLDPDHRLVQPAAPDLGEDDHEPGRIRGQEVVGLALGQRRL